MSQDLITRILSIAKRHPEKPIYVIGKCPSLEMLPDGFLPDGLVLNINDSELIIQGSIVVATEPWVADHLRNHAPSADLYLTSIAQMLPNEQVLKPVPSSLDRDGLVMQRMDEEELYAEDVGLVTAAKICKLISDSRQSPVEVYFLGFDFKSEEPNFDKCTTLGTKAQTRLHQAKIQSQENLFIQLQHYFSDRKLGILNHIGTKPYSSSNLATFLGEVDDLPRSPVEIPRSYQEAEAGRVFVVAEFTNNHLGDLDRLRRMVRLARNAGADLIKVQRRHVDSFYSQEELSSYYWSPFGTTLGDYRRGVELSDEGFKVLDEECRRNRLGWFTSILDLPSYHSLREFGDRLIKIPSTISNHTEYHETLSKEHSGGLVVSTGMTVLSYEKHILEQFGKANPLFLMQCTSAYPTPEDACQISVVRHYRLLAEQFPNLIPGFSSHDPGSLGCMMAVAAGAKMIEKHVSLGAVDWIHFDKVALDLESGEFASFVTDVRRAERYCGRESKTIRSVENHKYSVNS